MDFRPRRDDERRQLARVAGTRLVVTAGLHADGLTLTSAPNLQ
jgi:hypothetical protein